MKQEKIVKTSHKAFFNTFIVTSNVNPEDDPHINVLYLVKLVVVKMKERDKSLGGIKSAKSSKYQKGMHIIPQAPLCLSLDLAKILAHTGWCTWHKSRGYEDSWLYQPLQQFRSTKEG